MRAYQMNEIPEEINEPAIQSTLILDSSVEKEDKGTLLASPNVNESSATSQKEGSEGMEDLNNFYTDA